MTKRRKSRPVSRRSFGNLDLKKPVNRKRKQSSKKDQPRSSKEWRKSQNLPEPTKKRMLPRGSKRRKK